MMYTNYRVAVEWLGNHYILCNNICEIDESVLEDVSLIHYEDNEGNTISEAEFWELDTEEQENYNEVQEEIFQWFLSDCSKDDVDYLTHAFPGLLFSYSRVLDLYVLCVNHFGTSWDYVTQETNNEYAVRKLGEKK